MRARGEAALKAAAGTTARDRDSLWLRKMSDGTALLLPVTIDLEVQSDGSICATVEGLGGTLTGMGNTEDEAVQSAHLLLLGRVDHAIETGTPVESVLGKIPVAILPVEAVASLAATVKRARERAAAPRIPQMEWFGYQQPAFVPAEAYA